MEKLLNDALYEALTKTQRFKNKIELGYLSTALLKYLYPLNYETIKLVTKEVSTELGIETVTYYLNEGGVNKVKLVTMEFEYVYDTKSIMCRVPYHCIMDDHILSEDHKFWYQRQITSKIMEVMEYKVFRIEEGGETTHVCCEKIEEVTDIYCEGFDIETYDLDGDIQIVEIPKEKWNDVAIQFEEGIEDSRIDIWMETPFNSIICSTAWV